MTKRIVIIGAGGFARETAWAIDDINAASGGNAYETVGFVVSDPSAVTERDSPVLEGFDWLEKHRAEFDSVAIGIGTPAVRLKVAEDLRELDFPPLIHPSVRYSSSCTFGRGVIVCAGVICTVNVTVEDFVLVNLTCTIGHESTIGAGTVINPGVNISGGVKIGRGCLLGTGAQILQYVSIGDGGTVGAGAVVRKDVAEGSTVVGIPAAPIARR